MSGVRFLDVAQRVVLYALVIPVVLIVADAVLQFFDAREANEIVSFFRDSAEALTPVVVEDMFADQAYWQTALLSLVAYGVVALLFVALFRALRAVTRSLESE